MTKLATRETQWRTAVRPVALSPTDYRRAHEAAHALAGVWNQAITWVRGQWDGPDHHSPDVWETKRYLTTLLADVRPLHVHTTQSVAFDLHDALTTYRTNRRNGIKGRAPWREKKYRPLAFTRGYGWRVNPEGRLSLSLGGGRLPIVLPVPEVTDPTTGQPIGPAQWGEIKLCWNIAARRWSLHIAVPAAPAPVLDVNRVCAIDEGIINPFTLAAQTDDSASRPPVIDVLVVNGREARAVKRDRNKSIGQITRKMSKCADGSRRKRRLQRARKKVQARADARLHDFNHQVSRKAADFAITHDTGRIVAGDVRGIELRTRAKQRANRSTRQQLSQWERGSQEDLLQYKTGVELEHIDESYSSQQCPACPARNRPTGRRYRCRICGFTCHRDAVGAINILMRATHGHYRPIDPGTTIRVTYLRAVPRWSPDQRGTHQQVQRRRDIPTARARSKAPNQATGGHAVGVADRNPRPSATATAVALHGAAA
ncbi:MAG: transposase [Actinomycetota bacterium]|nr:transposase [Actinomycetota bacterium]